MTTSSSGFGTGQLTRTLRWLAALVLIAAVPAHAVTFKIATLSPDGSMWMKELRAAAKEVADKTGGGVKFKFYPGGVMGDDKAVLRKIRLGQLHGAVVTAGGLIQVYPSVQLYSLPLLFRSLDEVDHVRSSMDQRLIDGLRKKGQITFGIAEVGFAYAMARSPITSVAHARSQKVWSPDNDPGALEAFRAFDITPVTLPIADVLAGLQTGLISGVAGPPVGAIALQWHTQVEHGLDLPLLYVYGLLTVADKQFRKLSPEHQKAVSSSMSAAVARVNKRSRTDHESAKQALTNQGLVWHRSTASETSEWEQFATTATEKLISEGYVSEELYRDVSAMLEDYRQQKAL